MGQPESKSTRRRTRRDGWTPERQLGFLAALSRTRNVTLAARAIGMSRESAYRLRARHDGALFAAAWDGVVQRPALSVSKGHKFAAAQKSAVPISRTNPAKVTKWRKWKTPGFGSLFDQLREL